MRILGANWLALCLLAAATGAMLVAPVQAQSKKAVNEACENAADCTGGNCVEVADPQSRLNRRKVCSACGQSDLNSYTGEVQRYCKNRIEGALAYSDIRDQFGSKNEVPLQDLNFRLQAVTDCRQARYTRESKCFDGGDSAHKKEINDLNDAKNYVEGIISEKRRNKLGTFCSFDELRDANEDIDDSCKKMDEYNTRYVGDGTKDVACGDLEDAAEYAIDCREAYKYLADKCFKDGFPDGRARRFQEIQNFEKFSKEVFEKRKSAKTCK